MAFLNFNRPVFVLILLFAFGNLNSQTKGNYDIDISKLIEKVELNTDRDIYFNGEKIFYSADYFINGLQNTLLLSKVLYVELINCSDNLPILQKKIKISNFKANDVIIIPSNIISGNYMLRVYTQYQRNFSAYNYAHKFITILNLNNLQEPLIYDTNLDSIEIVPIGGFLFENKNVEVIVRIPNRLIQNNNSYYITNNDSIVVGNIYVSNEGFAQEEIALNDGNFKFIIKTENGELISKLFPKIIKSGILTTVEKSSNNMFYKIDAFGVNLKDFDYKVSIFSNDYILKYSEEVKLKNGKASIILPNKNFNTGLNYIVLFNDKDEIEKINSVYISPFKVEKINIQLSKSVFNTTENVEFSLSLNNSIAEQISKATISVSLNGLKKEVHDFIPDLYLANPLILEEYLLNLKNNNDLLEQQIMVLYNKRIDKKQFFEEINKSKVARFKYIPDVRDLSLKGTLRDKKTKEPVSTQDVFLSVPFNNPQLHVCKTDSDGSFIFSLNKITDINDIFVCARPMNNNQEYEIVINDLFSSDIPNLGKLPSFISDIDKELVEKLYINSQIKKNKKDNLERSIHKRVKTDNFNINYIKKTVFVDNYIKLKNVEEFFFELIPSVKYRKVKENYVFVVYDDNGWELPGEPLLLIDNIPIFDFSKVKKIKLSNIEKVEVINKKYYLGAQIFQGVIMITTNTDDFAGIKFPNSGVFVEYNAIEQASDEDCVNNIDSISSKTPDFRSVLYWNPSFKLSKDKRTINFTTSNCKGTYNIDVKAFNSKGEIYYGTKQITVK